VIQKVTDTEGGEIAPGAMWSAFSSEYLPDPQAPWGRISLRSVSQNSDVDGHTTIAANITDGNNEVTLSGSGNGPIAAFCQALGEYGIDVRVLDYTEHALSAGGDATAASYLECAVDGKVLWGVGIDPSITTSSLKGIISAVNRAMRD
jgi:2-isopropylmalate synthase